MHWCQNWHGCGAKPLDCFLLGTISLQWLLFKALNGWTASLSWLDFKPFMAGFEAFHGCISSLHGFFKNIELASLWWLWSGHKYSMLFHSGLPWLCVSMVPARLQWLCILQSKWFSSKIGRKLAMFFNKFVFQKRHRKETYNLGMEKEKLKFFFLEFFCKSWTPAICSTSFAFVEKSLKNSRKIGTFFLSNFWKVFSKTMFWVDRMALCNLHL